MFPFASRPMGLVWEMPTWLDKANRLGRLPHPPSEVFNITQTLWTHEERQQAFNKKPRAPE